MHNLTRIGLDLAKNVFHLIGFDPRDKEIKKKMLGSSQMLRYFVQLPLCVTSPPSPQFSPRSRAHTFEAAFVCLYSQDSGNTPLN